MISEYKTVCYYSEEDQSYIVFAPDLPGCFADGETIEEARENIITIINEWEECAQELGREIPSALTVLESSDPSVFDAANYILSKTGAISTMMLQKLLYYCKAWSLAWFHEPLFSQEFEAWSRGPICKELFNKHEGKFSVSQADISSKKTLTESERKLIDNVLSVYDSETPKWLSELTHSETPWIEARGSLPEDVRGNNVIPASSIEDYYSSLVSQVS